MEFAYPFESDESDAQLCLSAPPNNSLAKTAMNATTNFQFLIHPNSGGGAQNKPQYDKLIILDERQVLVSFPEPREGFDVNGKFLNEGEAGKMPTPQYAWIGSLKWEVSVSKSFDYYSKSELFELSIAFAKAHSTADEPIGFGEVVFFCWCRGTYVMDSFMFELRKKKQANFTVRQLPDNRTFFFVIRVLGKRPEMDPFETVCNPVSLIVDDQHFRVDKSYLSVISPVFQRMFEVDMSERQLNQAEIGSTSAEHFRNFLEAISPRRTPPNPSNVVALAELANRFQIPWLLADCEKHLISCPEVSVADRLILAEMLQLSQLKAYILHNLTGAAFQQCYRENRDRFRGLGESFMMALLDGMAEIR